MVASSLLLLGILGLVRSAVKLPLGLGRCLNTGFNVDSLRSLLGWLPVEFEMSNSMVEGLLIDVNFEKSSILGTAQEEVVIRKTRKFFDRKLTTIAGVEPPAGVELDRGRLHTVINLGDIEHERSLAQNPILIAFLVILYPGITTWLLMVAVPRWNWVTILAIPG